MASLAHEVLEGLEPPRGGGEVGCAVPVLPDGPRVHPVLHHQLDQVEVALLGGRHHRRLVVRGLRGRVGALPQQEVRRVAVAPADGVEERRPGGVQSSGPSSDIESAF